MEIIEVDIEDKKRGVKLRPRSSRVEHHTFNMRDWVQSPARSQK